MSLEDAIARGEIVAGGTYRVGAMLGRGGMATVYAATRLRDGAEVALKVASPGHSDRPDLAQRMTNELRFAAELAGHPNLVRPLGGGRLTEHGGAPYLVTELVRGPALTDVIVMQRQLSPRMAAQVGFEIGQALMAIARAEIVHRDVKPDNIVLAREADGRSVAKLIDFGLATKAAGAAQPGDRLTGVFERPGTKHYMAPEQAVGAPPTAACDVYALGATLYEMLLGAPPYGERSEDEAVARKLAADAPSFSLAGMRDDVPAALVDVVDAALARDPRLRPTAAALVERLRAVLVELGEADPAGAVAPNEQHGRATSASQRRRWPLVAIALAAGLATAGLVAGLQRPSGDAPTPAPDDGSTTTASPPSMPGHASAEPPRTPPATQQPPATAATAARESPSPMQPSATLPGASAPVQPRAAEPPGTAAVRPKPRGAPRTAPGTAAIAADSDACASARSDAAGAQRERRWSAVLAATARRECWRDQDERRHARLWALMALQRYDACAREGAGSQDPEIVDMAAACAAKAGGGAQP
ncbi:MAG: protein kinase [Nannocystaceae bacterium]